MARGRSPQPTPPPSPGQAPSAVAGVDALLVRLREDVRGAMCSVQSASVLLREGDVPTLSIVERSRDALHDASHRLESMSELVHAAMQSRMTPLGSPMLDRARPVTLGEAAEHACEVARSHALGAEVELSCDPIAARQPARAMYAVMLNALQNAVDSIAASCRRGGRVRLELRRESGACVLEIIDDGQGLPPHIPPARLCDLGVSSKPRGAGVGLAVARSIIRGMGGELTLSSRVHADGRTASCGAVFRATFPLLARTDGGTRRESA